MNTSPVLQPPARKSFADVAHGELNFDANEPADALVLQLIDNPWVQRLRSISQTGNTRAVYMFAEHSRFGHSLGVAFLATLLMRHLRSYHPELVKPYERAVAAAALLHDIGHVAPGSHLAERIWAPNHAGQHESVSTRIITEDAALSATLEAAEPGLAAKTAAILLEDESLPPWTHSIISGGGWNADRGNWAIVDSAMCAVSYGRYNVSALIDAFRLTPEGVLVIHESRLDALTHFFVARDSMYRQVYQHRVLQALDALTQKLVVRVRDILGIGESANSKIELSSAAAVMKANNICADETMLQVLVSPNYAEQLSLDSIFEMTEPWWHYHVSQWTRSTDKILADLATRYRDRKLFKTVRLPSSKLAGQDETEKLITRVRNEAISQGYDPAYYVTTVQDSDAHRGKPEPMMPVLLDSGALVPVSDVEPMIGQLLSRPPLQRRWLAVPKEVKAALGIVR